MATTERKEELKEILLRLNCGEDVEKVREDARELLKNIDPSELSRAEQELIEEGLKEDELKELCQAHIEATQEELKKLQLELEPGHPLDTLIKEHDKILEMLDELEQIKEEIKKLSKYDEDSPVFDRLRELAQHIIETEKHHDREEETIFPRLREEGVSGPANIMEMEHEDMWPRKERLARLAEEVEEMDFDEFKKKLSEDIEYLGLHLRDHIFKENNILYPTAQKLIAEDAWKDIEKRSDEIGYCCFTPEK